MMEKRGRVEGAGSVVRVSHSKKDVSVLFYEKHPFPNNPGRLSDPVYEEYFRRVVRMFAFEMRKGRCLVVGCGTGEELVVLRRLLPRWSVVAIEPSLESCRLARAKVSGCENVVVLNASIEEFVPTGKFDLVVCSGVLHHTADPPGNLKRMVPWLKMGGKMVLGVYHHARWDSEIPSGANAAEIADSVENPRECTYSWRGVLGLVDGAGLKAIATGHRLPVPRGRVWCAAYDGVWLYVRQQMLVLVLVGR